MSSLPLSVHHRLPKRMPLSYGFSKYGIQLDGVTQTLETGSIAMSGDRTWIIFFTPLYDWDDGALHDIMAWNAGSDRRMLIGKHSTNVVSWVHRSIADGGTHLGVNRTIRFYSGELHCTAVSVDVAAGILRAYWDDEFMGEDVDAGAAASLTSSVPLTVGGATWGYAPMIVHEILGYTRALSQEEILYNMLNYHNPIRDNLFLFVRCEEGTGLTAYDQSGLGNNMSLLPAADPPVWVRDRMWALRAEVGL